MLHDITRLNFYNYKNPEFKLIQKDLKDFLFIELFMDDDFETIKDEKELINSSKFIEWLEKEKTTLSEHFYENYRILLNPYNFKEFKTPKNVCTYLAVCDVALLSGANLDFTIDFFKDVGGYEVSPENSFYVV